MSQRFPERFYAVPGDSVATQCAYCVHARYAEGIGRYCGAFPGGVSDEILRNDVDHRVPYQGDTGSVVFEPRDGINPIALAALYRELDATHKP
jgi:hypothetical protein